MENLLNYHGYPFAARIRSTFTNGHITVEEGSVYLCQNTKSGSDCENKQGWKYSWNIGKGSKEDVDNYGISNFELLPKDLIIPSGKIEDPFNVFFNVKLTPKILEYLLRIYPNANIQQEIDCCKMTDMFKDGWIARVDSEYGHKFIICFEDEFDTNNNNLYNMTTYLDTHFWNKAIDVNLFPELSKPLIPVIGLKSKKSLFRF